MNAEERKRKERRRSNKINRAYIYLPSTPHRRMMADRSVQVVECGYFEQTVGVGLLDWDIPKYIICVLQIDLILR